MSSVMKNRVYGLIGISSIMANWNADFTGMPKTISNGEVFGSDKALKYSIKRYLKNVGEKVLFIKTYKIESKDKNSKNKLQPKSLSERYNEIFAPSVIVKDTPSKEVLKNLFSAADVMNFGATFAGDQNISITGAVQIGQGFNKYNETATEVQDILSPFRNMKNEDANASSLGKKIMSSEAHYIYPFSVNPANYDEYVGIVDGFEGYTREAYELFKGGALVGATALNTNSKSGCENEFALFIEFKEGSDVYLPNLDKYSVFEKGNDKNVIDITGVSNVVNNKFAGEIKNIEIYYNPFTTELKQSFKNADVMNIFTKEKS